MPYYSENEKGKQKSKAFIVTLIFVLVLIGSYFLLNYFQNREKVVKEESFSACALPGPETMDLLLGEDKEVLFEVRDFLFYGETLNIYENEYSLFEKDPLVGRTIILKNLCSQQDSYYLVSGKTDNQIPLESLEDGFYSIHVFYDSVRRKAYSAKPVREEFYTVRRDGVSKKITLIADSHLLDTSKQQDVLDRNYYYIQVETAEAPVEKYDIVLDPAYHYDVGDYVEYGISVNGLNKTEETYKIASVIKNKLEEAGLKVLITRSDPASKEVAYGNEGRLAKAYQSEAAYLVEIQLNSASNQNLGGTQIDYSAFCSSQMASSVFSYLLSHTELTPSRNKGTGNIYGLVPCGLVNGYDGRMIIRESGGRILGAGTFSEKAEKNSEFAKDSRFGLQALTIEYCYITNPKEAENWVNNLEKYGEVTAEAILNYLGVKNVTTGQ